MLALVPSSRFRKDVKRAEKRDKDMAKLRNVLTLLVQQAELPPGYRDHALRGDWRGFRDLHIEPDWLLLYRIAGDEVQLARKAPIRICFESSQRALLGEQQKGHHRQPELQCSEFPFGLALHKTPIDIASHKAAGAG